MTMVWYDDGETRFGVGVPEGWESEEDEEDGGLLLWPKEGDALLHLIGFARAEEEIPDPAEELYAFLDGEEIAIEEDEVVDLTLEAGDEAAYCEYIEEEEDEITHWLVGVATGPGQLVFLNFSRPWEEGTEIGSDVRDILGTIRFATIEE